MHDQDLASPVRVEVVFVARITDMRQTEICKIMTREEVASLQKEIQEETRAFPAALTASKKDWDADQTLKKIPFPSTKLSPRTLVTQGPFTDRNQAKTKLGSIAEDIVRDAYATKTSNKVDNRTGITREQAVDKAVELVSKKMQESLKRDIPSNRFSRIAPDL